MCKGLKYISEAPIFKDSEIEGLVEDIVLLAKELSGGGAERLRREIERGFEIEATFSHFLETKGSHFLSEAKSRLTNNKK